MALVIRAKNTGDVIAAGEKGADVRIFENNWYFNPNTVNRQHLIVTERTYTCPYKGVCFWIDLDTGVGTWVYRNPYPTYSFIKDQIGFYARPTSATIAEETNTITA